MSTELLLQQINSTIVWLLRSKVLEKLQHRQVRPSWQSSSVMKFQDGAMDQNEDHAPYVYWCDDHAIPNVIIMGYIIIFECYQNIRTTFRLNKRHTIITHGVPYIARTFRECYLAREPSEYIMLRQTDGQRYPGTYYREAVRPLHLWGVLGVCVGGFIDTSKSLSRLL